MSDMDLDGFFAIDRRITCSGQGIVGQSKTIKRADFEHLRTCRYCQTVAHSGEDCTHCGAPDDGKRGPLEMAPMNVVMA